MKRLISRPLRWLLATVTALLILGVVLTARTSASVNSQDSDPAATPPPSVADATATATPQEESPAPSTIDLVMYLRSQPQDDDACAMAPDGDRLSIDPVITNAAMSCPDMFAWKLLVEAIQKEFWKNWAPDAFTFPANPLPLCQADATDRTACCTPGSLTNPGYDDPENPGMSCPYFPGNHLDATGGTVLMAANSPAIAQDGHFEATVDHAGVSEGRAIRQEVAELVFRNEEMVDYIFENNIYHQDGLAEVFAWASDNMANRAPAHQRNAPGELAQITFPVPTVMIKTNWLHVDRAAELGITDDPDNPFVTMEIESAVIDNFGFILEPGIHYLVSIHIGSKDIPNWVWTTFEHVNNPGRCDMTGCSDSYGYATPNEVDDDQYDNFIVPNQRSDNLVSASIIADPGLVYSGDRRTPALEAIFQAFEIGTADSTADEAVPSIADPGWLSYRLKGTQVDYTDSVGRPNLVGNSVTEGGFVNTSSCMTCHSRAAVDDSGRTFFAIFLSELADDGYPQSPNGVPNPEWFFTTRQGERFETIPDIRTLPVDFVWGFMFAKPLETAAE